MSCSSSSSEKVQLAQREARKARRAGDDEAAVLWLGVAIRALREEQEGSSGGENAELLAAMLVSRGSARQRLHARLHGQGATRARANGFADDALADYVEASRRSPAMIKAHRKRIRVTLSNRRPLPVLLSVCADVHDAMGLGTVLTAVQWTLSQLELEPESELSDGQETDAIGEEARANAVTASVAGEVGTRAAEFSAVLYELERTVVTELVHKHATYADESLASVAVAVASEVQENVPQQHAQFGIVLSGTRPEMQRQEAAALWALLRFAQPRDLAVCADMLCRRLVAHLGADMSDLGARAVCQKDYRELACRCTVAEHLIQELRQMGLQPWCVESQQVHRPIAPRHCHDPAHAHRVTQRAAQAASEADAAELRALLLRAEASSSAADGKTGRDRAHDEHVAALMLEVAAAGHRQHSAAQNAQLLRQFNPTDRDEARAEPHNVGLGAFHRPTELTLVLGDHWDPLVSSLESWQRALAHT
eukprot:COSAG02_NODE_589_length_19902_cov_119.928939_11_plen_480_part_00